MRIRILLNPAAILQLIFNTAERFLRIKQHAGRKTVQHFNYLSQTDDCLIANNFFIAFTKNHG